MAGEIISCPWLSDRLPQWNLVQWGSQLKQAWRDHIAPADAPSGKRRRIFILHAGLSESCIKDAPSCVCEKGQWRLPPRNECCPLRNGNTSSSPTSHLALKTIEFDTTILKTWINFLSCKLDPYIAWPDGEEARTNQPQTFRDEKYKAVASVMDCSEFEIQTPTSFRYKAWHTQTTCLGTLSSPPLTTEGVFRCWLISTQNAKVTTISLCHVEFGSLPIWWCFDGWQGIRYLMRNCTGEVCEWFDLRSFPMTSGHQRQRCNIPRKWANARIYTENAISSLRHFRPFWITVFFGALGQSDFTYLWEKVFVLAG